MLPTLSKDRKPLLRSSSNERERPGMRNWPLFGFLFALVFFFYIVYVYQAQSVELESLRESFEKQVQLAKESRRDLIDAKAEGEKLKLQINTLTSERDDLKTRNTDCSSNLRTCSLKTEQFQSEKSKADDQIKEKDTEIETLQKNAAEVSSLRSLLTAQETISEQLNKTVLLLQDEIAVIKSNKLTGAPVAHNQVNSVAPVAPLAENQFETTKKLGSTAATPKGGEAVDAQGIAPKIETLPKEVNEGKQGEEDTLEKKEEAENVVDAPKPPAAADNEAEAAPKPADPDEPMKIKAGEYDDKPDV